MHQKLVEVQHAIDDLLHKTTFEEFRVAYQEHGLRPTKKQGGPRKRKSYRAPRRR